MTKQKYAISTLETSRLEIEALYSAYEAATGFPRTFVVIVTTAGGDSGLKGNPAFAKSFKVADFTHGMYDRVNSRLSGLWPRRTPWPADVPRQAPAEIDAYTLCLIAEKIAAREPAPGADKQLPGWPQGQPWPKDIPRPQPS